MHFDLDLIILFAIPPRRPYPSLRILFTSASLQIPGMLLSSFLSRIGDSREKRESILHARMAGRSVTARIKWVNRFKDQGRCSWIHCTPLLANNREVGVWMVWSLMTMRSILSDGKEIGRALR